MAAYYTNKSVVLEFTYRDVPIVIINADRGPHCCNNDHKTTVKNCPTCGQALQNRQVTLITVNNKTILQLNRVTKLHAKRQAERLIDKLYTKVRTDNPDGRPNGKGTPGQRPPPRRRTPPPSQGAEANQPPLPVPPIPPGMDLSFLNRGTKEDDMTALARLIKQCHKLGWGERAKQIILRVMEEKKERKD